MTTAWAGFFYFLPILFCLPTPTAEMAALSQETIRKTQHILNASTQSRAHKYKSDCKFCLNKLNAIVAIDWSDDKNLC
jgi:hypothetical protein